MRKMGYLEISTNLFIYLVEEEKENTKERDEERWDNK